MATVRHSATPHGHVVLPPRRAIWWVAAPAAAALLAAGSAQVHAASIWPLFLFHLSFLTLVALALPAPRSHAYSALAAVLVLGYWPKFVARLLDPSPYLEPIGDFDGSTASWNTALVIVAAGVAGVMAARLMQLWLERGRVRAARSIEAPFVYRRWRRLIWCLTAIAILVGYAWNAHAQVYAIGVNPRVVLPFGLNILLAWCYILAFPLWLAILMGWELADRRSRRLGWGLLWIPIVDGILSAGSLLSRATYLLRIAPYFLARSRAQHVAMELPRPGWLTLPVVGLGFAMSVAAVMALRTAIYFSPAPETAPTAVSVDAPAPAVGVPAPSVSSAPPADAAAAASPVSVPPTLRLAFVIHEVNSLFLDRWTGMEGVLAVTASQRNFRALTAVVREDPAVGNAAIYQRLAGSAYVPQERFTFLTLTGIIGVLATSGSLMFVLGGMALVSLVLMATEVAFRAVTRNEVACSVVAVTAAFVTSQVTFPRLYGVFLLELWVTLVVLAVLRRLLARVDDTRARDLA